MSHESADQKKASSKWAWAFFCVVLLIAGVIIGLVTVNTVNTKSDNTDSLTDDTHSLRAADTTWSQVYKYTDPSAVVSTALGSNVCTLYSWVTACVNLNDQVPTLVAYGDNRFGELGDGTVGAPGDRKLVNVNNDFLAPGESVVHIAGGEMHTVFLLNTGALWACGGNFHGQVGSSAPEDNVIPLARQVTFGEVDAKVAHVACGYTYTVAVMDDGVSVYMFGSNTYEVSDELYNQWMTDPTVGKTSPYKIESPLFQASNKIVQVACGGMHVVLRFEDGSLCGWGRHDRGQLANVKDLTDLKRLYVTDPTQLTGLPAHATAAHVVCGAFHTSVLTIAEKYIYTVGLTSMTGAPFLPSPPDPPPVFTREWVLAELSLTHASVGLVSGPWQTLAVIARDVYHVQAVPTGIQAAIVKMPGAVLSALGFRLAHSGELYVLTDAGELYVPAFVPLD